MGRRRRRKQSPRDTTIVLLLAASLLAVFYEPMLLAIPAAGVGLYAWLRYRRAQQRKNALLWAGDFDVMSGTQFEEMLCAVFENMGYDVKHTGKTGDFGADIVLRDSSGTRIAVQSKRKSANVGNDAVQQALAGKHHYRADEGWVVTNSRYTDAAKTQARSCGITLVDRDKLLDIITKARSRSAGGPRNPRPQNPRPGGAIPRGSVRGGTGRRGRRSQGPQSERRSRFGMRRGGSPNDIQRMFWGPEKPRKRSSRGHTAGRSADDIKEMFWGPEKPRKKSSRGHTAGRSADDIKEMFWGPEKPRKKSSRGHTAGRSADDIKEMFWGPEKPRKKSSRGHTAGRSADDIKEMFWGPEKPRKKSKTDLW